MSTWIAKDAVIFGDVVFGEDCSVFYHSVIRAESGRFVFGERTNIQDNCVVHGGADHPVTVGNGVSIGHGCILHGCEIGDDVLIGMGSIVMNDARIGKNVLIGAGSLITERTVIPDNCVAFGRPAKVIRPISQKELDSIHSAAAFYVREKELHATAGDEA